MQQYDTEAATGAALALEGATPHTIDHDGRTFLVHSVNQRVMDITDPHGLTRRPSHILQAVTLETKDSLVDYVNRYKTAGTVLFANIAASTIVAALNYHDASNAGGEGLANHADHRAKLVLPLSTEWKDWAQFDKTGHVSQKDFARWIEEHAGDVAAPLAADLLEMCRDLQSLRRVSFIEAVRRTNSDAESFTYKNETDIQRDGHSIDIPTLFELSLPVYFGEPNTSLMAYLRWNIGENGQLTLGIKLSRAEYVRQAVFKQIVAEVGERAKVPVLYGTIGPGVMAAALMDADED